MADSSLGNCYRISIAAKDGNFPMVLGYAATLAVAFHIRDGLKKEWFILPSDVITIEKTYLSDWGK